MPNSTFKLLAAAAVLVFANSCKTWSANPEIESSGKFTSGIAPGHELITELALKIPRDPKVQFNGKQGNSSDWALSSEAMDFYRKYWKTLGLRRHPIIEGVWLTDYTDKNRIYGQELSDFIISSDGEFEAHNRYQVTLDSEKTLGAQFPHFTRDLIPKDKGAENAEYNRGGNNQFVASGQETCNRARAFIIAASKRAIEIFSRKGDDEKRGLVYVGAALHTIQDSFSSAHTKRDMNQEFWPIEDICTWEYDAMEKISGLDGYYKVCRHSRLEAITADGIFDHSSEVFGAEFADAVEKTTDPGQDSIKICSDQVPNFYNNRGECFTGPASMAIKLSARYLEIMAPHLRSGSAKELEAELANYFDDQANFKSGNGYFSCKCLTNDHPVQRQVNDPKWLTGVSEVRTCGPHGPIYRAHQEKQGNR